MVTKGWRGWEELGDWNWHIHTIDTMYKLDNQWEPTAQHGESYLMLHSDLKGKENQKGGDMCIHINDSLCWTAEANTL